MSYTSSRDIWLAFEHNLSYISHAQAAQLHTQLETTCKGAMSANIFFPLNIWLMNLHLLDTLLHLMIVSHMFLIVLVNSIIP